MGEDNDLLLPQRHAQAAKIAKVTKDVTKYQKGIKGSVLVTDSIKEKLELVQDELRQPTSLLGQHAAAAEAVRDNVRRVVDDLAQGDNKIVAEMKEDVAGLQQALTQAITQLRELLLDSSMPKTDRDNKIRSILRDMSTSFLELGTGSKSVEWTPKQIEDLIAYVESLKKTLDEVQEEVLVVDTQNAEESEPAPQGAAPEDQPAQKAAASSEDPPNLSRQDSTWYKTYWEWVRRHGIVVGVGLISSLVVACCLYCWCLAECSSDGSDDSSKEETTSSEETVVHRPADDTAQTHDNKVNFEKGLEKLKEVFRIYY